MIAPPSLFLVECVEPCRQPLDGGLQALDLVADPGAVLASVKAWIRTGCAAAPASTAEATTARPASATPSCAAPDTALGICPLDSRSGTVSIWHEIHLPEVLVYQVLY